MDIKNQTVQHLAQELRWVFTVRDTICIVFTNLRCILTWVFSFGYKTKDISQEET